MISARTMKQDLFVSVTTVTRDEVGVYSCSP